MTQPLTARLASGLLKPTSGWFTRDVPLDLIRHNDVPVYKREGHGGKPIAAWPIYTFVKLTAKGGKTWPVVNSRDGIGNS